MSSRSSKPLCRYFASNCCFKGDDCPFSHDRNARPEGTCRYYLAGTCAYGSSCRYDHIRPSTTTTAPAASSATSSVAKPSASTHSYAVSNDLVPAPAPAVSAWNTPLNGNYSEMQSELSNIARSTAGMPQRLEDTPLCPYYEMGYCMNGDLCAFIHGTLCEMCGRNSLHPFNERQSREHHRQCLGEHEKAMEEAFAEARSVDKQCGICMEKIVDKELRFGILQNCKHCFCLACIRQWRKNENEQFETKTIRQVLQSCPECRVHSDYIIPSSTWVEDQADKDKLTSLYQENMKQKQCKYVKEGRVDDCPFGNKCFYKHQLPNGSLVAGDSPRTLRRKRQFEFTLSDFFSSDTDSDDDDEPLMLTMDVLRSFAATIRSSSRARSDDS